MEFTTLGPSIIAPGNTRTPQEQRQVAEVHKEDGVSAVTQPEDKDTAVKKPQAGLPFPELDPKQKRQAPELAAQRAEQSQQGEPRGVALNTPMEQYRDIDQADNSKASRDALVDLVV